MVNRIDKLYSVERLRETWQQSGDTPEKKTPASVGPPELNDVLNVFDHLSMIVRQRFQGDQIDVLNMLLDQLRQLLVHRFDKKEASQETSVDQSAMNSAMDDILNQIEDLTEAYELKILP